MTLEFCVAFDDSLCDFDMRMFIWDYAGERHCCSHTTVPMVPPWRWARESAVNHSPFSLCWVLCVRKWGLMSVPVVIHSPSSVWLFATPWTPARQASLSFTISHSLLKPMSSQSVIPSSHLILCRPLLLLLPIPLAFIIRNTLKIILKSELFALMKPKLFQVKIACR